MSNDISENVIYLCYNYKTKSLRSNHVRVFLPRHQTCTFWSDFEVLFLKWINWVKCKFSAILIRHCCDSNRYVIQCITLVSFFSEISLGSFWGWNLQFLTFQETVRSHLNSKFTPEFCYCTLFPFCFSCIDISPASFYARLLENNWILSQILESRKIFPNIGKQTPL